MRPSNIARSAVCAALLAASALLAAAAGARPVDITTYHYDNFRTGWNRKEKTLTPANVASAQFQMIASTVLDDQVDAQPLVLSSQSVNGQTAREVVYIATEANTVYAIDANTGEVLLQRNLGAPVPRTSLPGQCPNGGPNLGINSTPTMDPQTHTIYLIAYTYEGQKPVYHVHALDPATLQDTVKPRLVTARAKLTDGTTYEFNPHESRQRPGLLLSKGKLYAGFGSFCDYDANLSRGWILGWKAKNLKPLPANELTDSWAHTTHNFFLSAIWMSGYGLAASAAGDVYFITGNSDYAGDSFDPVNNIEESVVQMPPDLSGVKHLFTPMDAQHGWKVLDQNDQDFGAGGFMLIPPQKGQPSNLAVATGKVAVTYVFNADDVSNGQPNGGMEYSHVTSDPCWCGPSYFVASDGKPRIVTSGGNNARVYKLDPKGTPSLTLDKTLGQVEGIYFPGFLTSVSSNGTRAGTQIVWAMGRPTDFGQEVLKLHAFDAEKGGQIFVADAGYWTNSISDSNTVPVVANGKVYVATVKSLTIWGLKKNGAQAAAMPPPPAIVDTRAKLAPGEHEIRGTVRGISGYRLTVELRDGKTLAIDAASAAARYRVAPPSVGHALVARGPVANGTMKAVQIGHAPDHGYAWPPDR
ncbi:MAG TPA: hypothetical protein VG819_13390 [Rhizomicrobium sp.]|nr:hypothetical protein [Rhizomicrobium sp.]